MADWERVRMIGKGSSGKVYLAKQKPTSEEAEESDLDYFAVKTAHLKRCSSLWREKDILKHFIGCPEIVQCLGSEITTYSKSLKPIYNLKLEYATGGTLADLIKQKEKLPENEVKEYLRMILRGLSEIHSKGFVHSDLKPQNILAFLQSDGKMKLKIADFGLSVNNKLSGSNKFKGTPMYMSPESIMFREYNVLLDIWSLGCILVEMISGKYVWENCSSLELVQKIVVDKEVPKIPDELSIEGKNFIKKCFDRNTTQRWEAYRLLQHPYLIEKEKNPTQIEWPNLLLKN